MSMNCTWERNLSLSPLDNNDLKEMAYGQLMMINWPILRLGQSWLNCDGKSLGTYMLLYGRTYDGNCSGVTINTSVLLL